MNEKYDYVIVGAGVVGLAIAYRLLEKNSSTRLLIIEKEEDLGRHASGRNSGVVHAGIYYSTDSNKARFCRQGNILLTEYAQKKNIPIENVGKVVVATKPELVDSFDLLMNRSKEAGVPVEEISLQRLKEIEPLAHSYEKALWSPSTSIIDSKAVLASLKQDIEEMGGLFLFNRRVDRIDSDKNQIEWDDKVIQYGCLINSADLFADKIATEFALVPHYRILPFKGIYWGVKSGPIAKIKTNIYPVPDLKFPFLGIHFTPRIGQDLLIGPTALPALGRENYGWLEGIEAVETMGILSQLLKMYLKNSQNFRGLVHEEVGRYFKAQLLKHCQALVPTIQSKDIGDIAKVGIRAQLVDLKSKKLVMDFEVHKAKDSVHVLNAISPAFTCSFSFADYILDKYI